MNRQIEVTKHEGIKISKKIVNNSINNFASDILTGLTTFPKKISSKYFYDDEGSRIFQKIMELPEYYLTRAETEIFEFQKASIVSSFLNSNKKINLIELGAGDGIKTKILLDYLLQQNITFSYTAIDISFKALEELRHTLEKDLPNVDLRLYEGDYLDSLNELKTFLPSPKVVMFLGSNIGNYNEEEVYNFLKEIRMSLSTDDKIFIGFDLKKDPKVIINAYNDSKKITSSFNLNLLSRINEELGGNFNLSTFTHHPVYDLELGEAKSYLRSFLKQRVYIDQLKINVDFEEGELIHTEVSKKYDFDLIQKMAEETGFTIQKNFLDARGYFCDSLWQAI